MSAESPDGGAVTRWWRGIGSPRVRAALLVILVAGGALRVAWVAHAAVKPKFVTDPEAYLLQGERIAHGHGYTNPLVAIENSERVARHEPTVPEQPASYYPPGYPAFIAVVAWIVWHTPIPDDDGAVVRSVAYAQALLGVLSILLLFELARRIANTRVALVAAGIMALYPGLITLTATLQLETVFIALTLATMLVLFTPATVDRPPRTHVLIAGAMIGAVSLVRPTVALLIVAVLVTRLAARRPWRETVAAMLLLVAGTVAVVAPWTIRNALTLHAFVPLSTGIGSALCQSRAPGASGGLDSHVLAVHCTPPPAHRTPARDDVVSNNYATHQAVQWSLHHPLSEIAMWWHRTYYAYRNDTTGIQDFGAKMSASGRHLVTTVSDVVAFVVLALAGVGAAMLLWTRRRTRGAVYLVASTVCFAAVPIILFGDPRYRVPAEPLFIVLAAVALCTFVDRVRGTTA